MLDRVEHFARILPVKVLDHRLEMGVPAIRHPEDRQQIAVERLVKRLPLALFLEPGAGRRRGRQGGEGASVEHGVGNVVHDRIRGQRRAEDAVDIALDDRGRHPEPQGIDEHHDIRLPQQPEFARDVRRQMVADRPRAMIRAQPRVEIERVEVAQVGFLPARADRFAIAFGDRVVETVFGGMAEDDEVAERRGGAVEMGHGRSPAKRHSGVTTWPRRNLR